MKHTKRVKHYPEGHEGLAENLGDLYYDSLADFLKILAEKIHQDGEADRKRGRPRLAAELLACSDRLQEAAAHIDAAWTICKPYMDK